MTQNQPAGIAPVAVLASTTTPIISVLVRLDALDIREGHADNPFGNPLALAIARIIGRPVRVNHDGVKVLGSIFEICPLLPLPAEAKTWHGVHIWTGEGKPLTFVLNVPRALLGEKALRHNERAWEAACLAVPAPTDMVVPVHPGALASQGLTFSLCDAIGKALGLTWTSAHGAPLGAPPVRYEQVQQGGAA